MRLVRFYGVSWGYFADVVGDCTAPPTSWLRAPGHAHAFENGLELGHIGRVVARRRPGCAGARDGEARVERETGFDRGTRLVQSAQPREGDGQLKICMRMVSIGLDRPSKPCDRLLPLAEVILLVAHRMHRTGNPRVTRTEAQAFQNMSLCFFGPTDINLTQSDSGMGAGEISIQR